MNIFICSTNTIESQNSVFTDLLDYLKSDGHNLFHYINDSKSGESKYTFDQLIAEISNADVFIAEMSQSSQTLGFQLAHALQISKPVLYLYSPNHKNRPQGLIGNIPSRGLKIKHYTDANYIKVLEDFLEFAGKQMLTTRTSFISTKEIDEYVGKESKRLGISKGEALRQLLHKAIES